MPFTGSKLLKQSAQLLKERVLGDYSRQIASFEWVFSPRGEDGRPEQLFDRDTGAIYPVVANHYRGG